MADFCRENVRLGVQLQKGKEQLVLNRARRLSLAVMACALGVSAQNSVIQGLVTDPAQAVVAGAQVTVANTDTGRAYKAVTNGDGHYAVPFLPAGAYRVTAMREGFAPAVREGLKLEVQQVARVDLMLALGWVSETVDVAASRAQVESDLARMGQVVENKVVAGMPLSGRNYLELAPLAGGALPASVMGIGARTGSTGGFTAMGSQAYQTTISVDGVDNTPIPTGGAQGQVAQATTPSLDSVSEFRVVTNNFSAEHGFRMGPQVFVSLKTGTNQLHGSLYEYVRNDHFDAANFFANRSGAEKPAYRQSQFGGTLGGPLRPERTFFFASYEGTRIRQGTSRLTTVPGAAARSGDFSRERTNLNRVFDPATTVGAGPGAYRLPFPNQVVPESRWDPVSRGLTGLFPEPNVAGRQNDPFNYFSAPVTATAVNQFDYRLDDHPAARDKLYFSHSLSRNVTVTPPPLPVAAGSDGGQSFHLPAQNLGFGWIRALKPNLYNEARFGYLRFHTLRDTLITEPLNAFYGIHGAPGDSFGDGGNKGFTHFQIGGYTNLGTPCCEPNYNDTDSYQFYNNVVMQAGGHSVKFGGEYRQNRVLLKINRFRRGQFSFSKVYTAQFPEDGASRVATGNPLADMMLGAAARTTAGTLAGIYNHSNFWAGYVQDDWKVTPRLTLNLGLRWEYAPPAVFPDGGPAIRQMGVSNYLTELAGVQRGDPRYGTFARPRDGRDCGCEPKRDALMPRLGLALRVSRRTVVRAAVGSSFGLVGGASVWGNQTPDANEVTTAGTNTRPAAWVREGLPLFPIPAHAPVHGSAVSAALTKQYRQSVWQWFLDIQREMPGGVLLTAGYSGSKSTHLGGLIDLNYPGPHPVIPAVQRRLDPRWIAIGSVVPWGNANFHGLIAKAEKRYASGLSFIAAYTLAKNIDNVTQMLDTGFTIRTNPFDWNMDRGRSNLDIRHSMTASFTYELPYGRGGWRERIFGHWQAGGILAVRSGFPFEVQMPGDAQNSGTINRGNRVGSGRLANPAIERWFDESAFVAAPPGVYGNAGRNVLEGPGSFQFDALLARRFRMPWEGHSLQLRGEAFNATNTARFGQPNGILRTPATAAIATADHARRLQLALRYEF